MEENTPNHEEVFKSRKKGTFTLFIHYLCVFPLQLKTHIFTYTNQQSPICIHLQLSETKILRSFQDNAERNGKTGELPWRLIKGSVLR